VPPVNFRVFSGCSSIFNGVIMKPGRLKWILGAMLFAAVAVYCAYLFMPRPAPKNVPRLAAGMEIFRNGQSSRDAAVMEKALRLFEDTCMKEPGSYEAWHMKSLTELHLLLHSRDVRDTEGEAVFSRAAEHSAMKVTALQSTFPEAYAMLAAVTALRPPQRGQTAAVRRYEKLALMLGGNNPRVHYLLGLRYYLSRGRLRNPDRAEELFLKAAGLFEREPPGARAFNFPSWGHAASLEHLGDIHEERGDVQAAAGYYRRALAVNPFLEPVRRSLQDLKDARSGTAPQGKSP